MTRDLPTTYAPTTRETPGLVIRQRQDKDLPALEALLERQQPASLYPVMWPLPMGSRAFIKRSNEHRSWVAELHGEIVGHISVTGVDESGHGDDKLSVAWAAAHGGVDWDRLRQISGFFTDLDRAGSNIGHNLMATATEYAQREGYPVLNANAETERPVKFYARRGWKVIDEQPAPWDPTNVYRVVVMVLPREQLLA